MSTSSKFYILSEELLTAIAKELITSTCDYWLIKDVFPRLKALRLSSPRFAHLDLIRKTLFGGLQLVATPERFEHLAQTDISQIALFVKTVTFVAPPKCWTLTFEGFREVVLAQAIQKHAAENKIWDGDGSYAFEDDGHRKFIERHWNGKLPLSDDELRVGYAKYRDDALAARDVLLGDGLRAAWTRTLRALPNVHSSRFMSVDYDENGGSHLPMQPDCIIRPHRHDQIHRDETCRRVAAPVGNAVFAAGIACLADAKVKVQSLDVACAMTSRFEWESLPGWEKLNLSQMQTFTFQPQVQSIGEDLDILGRSEDVVAERAADAVAAVLKKCGDSLEKLRYQNSCPMQWPGGQVIRLPKLKHLSLDSGSIRPRHLKTWMSHMPSLEHFQLDGSSLCEHSYYGWRDVFDAIRDHPRGLHVHFDQIIANDCAEISLYYDTEGFQEFLDQQEDEDPWGDINRSLPLYLSGKIDYNASLKEWLQDE